MRAPTIDDVVGGLDSLDLDELERCAPLLTRQDRKYIVGAGALAALLADLPPGVRSLDAGHGRWSRYESTYFDTPELDSFHLAATGRRNRFKVRARCYVDPATSVLEVKTKDRRGRTVKCRQPLESGAGLDAVASHAVRSYAREFPPVEPFASDLRARLTTSYRRATLVLPGQPARVTIDADFLAVDADGTAVGLSDKLVVETKTDGVASVADRLLWAAGHRPVRFSKYSTALAALHPDLPHNRWNRVLVEHFDRGASRAAPGGSFSR